MSLAKFIQRKSNENIFKRSHINYKPTFILVWSSKYFTVLLLDLRHKGSNFVDFASKLLDLSKEGRQIAAVHETIIWKVVIISIFLNRSRLETCVLPLLKLPKDLSASWLSDRNPTTCFRAKCPRPSVTLILTLKKGRTNAWFFSSLIK